MVVRAEALSRLNRPGVLLDGNGKPVTAVARWQKALQTVFELAKVQGAHSHRFRDSFAVSLL